MTEPESYTIRAGYRYGRQREVTLQVGRVYVVDQINRQATRNRGRLCELLAFVPRTEEDGYIVAKVRYLDNHRQGRVDLGDLAEVGE